MIAGILEKWNADKVRALQLADDGKKLWQESYKTHRDAFTPVDDLKKVAPFPADVKQKSADLLARLNDFQNTAQYAQTLAYCRDEIPAYYLLNALANLTDQIAQQKIREAWAIAQQTLPKVGKGQISALYAPIQQTFNADAAMVEDRSMRYYRQLAKARKAEDDSTDKELLIEYQKANDLIPDAAVANKITVLQDRIKDH
jgi:hypothetical protein